MIIKIPDRVLICGMGSIGRRYCREINESWPSIKIAALRSGSSDYCAEENKLNASFNSIELALKWEPEAAIIASPASCHVEQALRLSEQQIPLLIEKPVGTGLENSTLLKRLLENADSVPMYLGYVLRHDQCISNIRNLITSDGLGEFISADFYCGSWLPSWRPNQNYKDSVSAQQNLGGGALLELSHEIDLAEWLIGPITINRALLRNSDTFDIDVEDQAYLLGQNKKGCPISIRLEFCTSPAKRTISLHFTNSQITCDLLKGEVKKLTNNSEKVIYAREKPVNWRFHRQLELFWELPAYQETSLCSLNEGLNILNLISHARSISTKP